MLTKIAATITKTQTSKKPMPIWESYSQQPYLHKQFFQRLTNKKRLTYWYRCETLVEERERDSVSVDEEAAEEEEVGQGGDNDCVADHDMRDDARKESYKGAAGPDIGGRRRGGHWAVLKSDGKKKS
jgi:hypothetical protein